MNNIFKISVVFICILSQINIVQAQKITINNTEIKSNSKAKLVVGLVLDQMKWEYLYYYQNRYTNGGFKRLLREGFTAENTYISYTPTVTACGHAGIYSGSVPAIHGIVGNSWYDKKLQKIVYCCEDTIVKSVGDINNNDGKMSPRNMFVNTISDQMRLATNFRGKSIGISIKDRGAILPAGHSANAAYWYSSKSGNFITSNFYMDNIPTWVSDFNQRKIYDSLLGKEWNTLFPIDTYLQSEGDSNEYEVKTKLGKISQNTFPYNFSDTSLSKKALIRATPFGNTLTLEFAKKAIINENLGKDNDADMLAISLSSPDYIGHQFGPNSIEMEDNYLRVDKDIENFLNFLDAKVGKGNYIFFISADHGVANVPQFLNKHNMPGDHIMDEDLIANLNKEINNKFGIDKLILNAFNYQLMFDESKIKDKNIDDIINFVLPILKKNDFILDAFDITKMASTNIQPKLKEMLLNGYYHQRCGHIQYILKPGFIDGWANKGGTTHGLWNPYDSHIPFVIMGTGVKQGKTFKETYMCDIAPTLAALLNIQGPNGSIGKVVTEAIK